MGRSLVAVVEGRFGEVSEPEGHRAEAEGGELHAERSAVVGDERGVDGDDPAAAAARVRARERSRDPSRLRKTAHGNGTFCILNGISTVMGLLPTSWIFVGSFTPGR